MYHWRWSVRFRFLPIFSYIRVLTEGKNKRHENSVGGSKIVRIKWNFVGKKCVCFVVVVIGNIHSLRICSFLSPPKHTSIAIEWRSRCRLHFFFVWFSSNASMLDKMNAPWSLSMSQHIMYTSVESVFHSLQFHITRHRAVHVQSIRRSRTPKTSCVLDAFVGKVWGVLTNANAGIFERQKKQRERMIRRSTNDGNGIDMKTQRILRSYAHFSFPNDPNVFHRLQISSFDDVVFFFSCVFISRSQLQLIRWYEMDKWMNERNKVDC